VTSLALSMIVRDAAGLLPQCLESVRGVVQEMVIADTGSRDDSKEIALAFGARVIQIPWHNDFAEARNLCLDSVHSDWVLSLDADELLDPTAAGKLAPLLANSSITAYQVTIRNFVRSLQDRIWDRPAIPNDSPLPSGKPFPAYVDHQNVRLFRNEKSIRFVGRVHESVGPSLLKQKRAIAHADFLIYHFGLAAASEDRAAKNIFYRELGRQKLLEMPTDAQAHLELGLVEMDNFANLDEALHLFARACQLNPRLGPAWFFQGLVLVRLQKFSEGLKRLATAESLGHRTALVAEIRGDAFYNLGSFRQSVNCYQTALHREPASPGLISKLGLALVRSGNPLPGLRHLHLAIAQHPQAAELHDRKMLALFSLGDIPGAAQALESKLLHILHPAASDYLRAASLWSKAANLAQASLLIARGLQLFPEDKKLLIARDELSPISSSLIFR